MTNRSEDEAELVLRAMKGDGAIFGFLYERYLGPIYRYIYFRVGNAADAEDLTEQVFLNAWEALPTFKPHSNRFLHWLYTIARNLTIDHHRRQKEMVSSELIEMSGWETDHKSAFQNIEQAEENQALAKAISELPDEQQQVVLLRFIEGMRHAEVARIMDKSEGACRVLQFQALAALNRKLIDMREGDDGRG